MMPITTRPPASFAVWRRFRRNRRGSAAIEFALVAPMFFALLFAIVETALVFFAGQTLETGTQDAARAFLTRQMASGSSAADFKQLICDRVSALFACSDIYVDVQTYPAGTAITISDPIDGSGNFVNNFVYNPPSSTNTTDTVVVRAFYQWPLYVTKLGYDIANIGKGTSNSKRLLAATAALRPQ